MGIAFGTRYPNKCTVWGKEVKERFTKVKVTTSKKNRDKAWETDFSSYCLFIGDAHKKAAELSEKDKITITSFEVQCRYDKEHKCERPTFLVYDFEWVEKNNDNASSSDGFMDIPDGLDEEMPFQ